MISAVLKYLSDSGSASASDRLSRAWLLAILGSVLVLVCLLAIGTGAVPVGWLELFGLIADALNSDGSSTVTEAQKHVLVSIRLPRVALAVLAGAGLAVSGAALQGLFRNPLADPGLIGVSSGAALGASLMIVTTTNLAPSLLPTLGGLTLPLPAFLGGLATTWIVYQLATRDGHAEPAYLLLAGIAVNALVGAAIGLFTYVADDQQLRSLSFWSLGSLAGASWASLVPTALLVIPAIILLLKQATRLNALMLGETEAMHVGIDVQRLKRHIIICSALSVGALVAVCGMIAFIGLVAPHLLRLLAGPDHRRVLPGTALMGSILLSLADLVSRTLVAPAELPIGIITSLLGAPFFLWLLVGQKLSGHK